MFGGCTFIGVMKVVVRRPVGQYVRFTKPYSALLGEDVSELPE